MFSAYQVKLEYMSNEDLKNISNNDSKKVGDNQPNTVEPSKIIPINKNQKFA